MDEKFDFKAVYKDLYQPPKAPSEILVPEMLFLAVDGRGNPNDAGGEYQHAVELLYAVTFTIKMSKMGGQTPPGYMDYVVPPLEGLWWLEDLHSMDFTHKDRYCWTSLIRQPEFVTEDVFIWACEQARKKKPGLDFSKIRRFTFAEGLCVQAMHTGPYETEPATIAKIEEYLSQHSLANDIGASLPGGMLRRHHEIYLGDPRKTAPEKRKTVLRHPVKRQEG